MSSSSVAVHLDLRFRRRDGPLRGSPPRCAVRPARLAVPRSRLATRAPLRQTGCRIRPRAECKGPREHASFASARPARQRTTATWREGRRGNARSRTSPRRDQSPIIRPSPWASPQCDESQPHKSSPRSEAARATCLIVLYVVVLGYPPCERRTLVTGEWPAQSRAEAGHREVR